jgi:hypothetical protein
VVDDADGDCERERLREEFDWLSILLSMTFFLFTKFEPPIYLIHFWDV